jgi:hypothetical protein
VRRAGDTTTVVDTDSRNGRLQPPPAIASTCIFGARSTSGLAPYPRATTPRRGSAGRDVDPSRRLHRGIVAGSARGSAGSAPVRGTAYACGGVWRDDRRPGDCRREPLSGRGRADAHRRRSWSATLEVLWRYVNSQNAIFTSEEDAARLIRTPADPARASPGRRAPSAARLR